MGVSSTTPQPSLAPLTRPLLSSMNANSIPASAWMLLEILSSPTLESRVRAELAASLITPSIPSSSTTARKANIVPSYDVVKLCASPLLQSIYAETLRLRVAIMGTRLVISPSLSLSTWQFQHGDILAYVSSLAALDPTVWSTGREDDPHPLTEFWADRFLVYPLDRDSGPLLRQSRNRKARGAKTSSLDPGAGAGARQDPNLNAPASAPTKEPIPTEKSTEKSHIQEQQQQQQQQQQPQFSLEGLAASWIPYGGGVRLCPGRHFAKQEMLVSAAVWLTAYEVELRPGEKYEVDKDYYGFGTMPPKGKIAARIRRRMS
jgi:Cytochrome P450